jgi:hypothetical protein
MVIGWFLWLMWSGSCRPPAFGVLVHPAALPSAAGLTAPEVGVRRVPSEIGAIEVGEAAVELVVILADSFVLGDGVDDFGAGKPSVLPALRRAGRRALEIVGGDGARLAHCAGLAHPGNGDFLASLELSAVASAGADREHISGVSLGEVSDHLHLPSVEGSGRLPTGCVENDKSISFMWLQVKRNPA